MGRLLENLSTHYICGCKTCERAVRIEGEKYLAKQISGYHLFFCSAWCAGQDLDWTDERVGWVKVRVPFGHDSETGIYPGNRFCCWSQRDWARHRAEVIRKAQGFWNLPPRREDGLQYG